MGRLRDLVGMLTERRIGFSVDEEMHGTHRFLRDYPPGAVSAGTELPFGFTASWGHPKLGRYLRPGAEFLQAALEGKVSAGGLCEDAPMRGALELRYLQDASVRYTFEFEAHGQRMRYVGEKRDIRPWNLHRTHTTCRGTVTEVANGEPLSDSVVHFDLGLLPRFFASFRLT